MQAERDLANALAKRDGRWQAASSRNIAIKQQHRQRRRRADINGSGGSRIAAFNGLDAARPARRRTDDQATGGVSRVAIVSVLLTGLT
jgi:hypothetical protein